MFGTVVPIKSAFGLNLFEGNNPYGDGVMQYTKGFFPVEEREKIHRRPETPEELKRKEMLSEAEREQKRRLNEVEADKLMFRKAMEFITAEPEKVLLFTMRRIFAFWSPVNLYRTTSYDGLRALVYGVPLILGLVGILWLEVGGEKHLCWPYCFSRILFRTTSRMYRCTGIGTL